MTSVLQSPEDTWSFQPLEGAHFQRSFKHIETGQPAAKQPEAYSSDDGSGVSLEAMMRPPEQKDTNPEVCIPTNPGTLLHPGSCTPCAFVFRVAEGQVRNRCTNGDQCGWCHHPSHPRTRGRRQKNGASARQKEAAQQQEAWADKNGSGSGNGSETSTRDSLERDSDRETKGKPSTWTAAEDNPKTNRSTKDDRGNAKSFRAGRDDRAKSNRQRNDRDDRSKNSRNPFQPEKVERCSTPEFDEQYSCYPRPQNPQGFAAVVPENCYGQSAPILYSCVPVSVAVPAPAAEGMPEWAGYAPTATYMHDYNASYQQDVRGWSQPQGYYMLPIQQPQPTAGPWRGPVELEGQWPSEQRSRESA
jgi:hypothetical protein